VAQVTDWTSDRLSDPNDPDPEARRAGLDVSHGGQTTEGVGPVRELDLDRPDELAAGGATIRQLALDEQVWRFGHVIVDEGQDLTPMQWRMVVRRSRKGAVTILGDLAQRSIGDPGSWEDHLPPELLPHAQRDLTVNYRSPAEINELASAVLRRLAPDLVVSRSVRRSGHTPEVVAVDDLDRDLPGVVARVAEREAQRPGRVLAPAVIGFDLPDLDRVADGDRLGCRPLSPWQAKGLEFDAVVVVEPARFLDEPNGLSLLYVALTRSTDRLTLVHRRPLPDLLGDRAGPNERDDPPEDTAAG
jgi:superfamily I DNA/RNA helicase